MDDFRTSMSDKATVCPGSSLECKCFNTGTPCVLKLIFKFDTSFIKREEPLLPIPRSVYPLIQNTRSRQLIVKTGDDIHERPNRFVYSIDIIDKGIEEPR